MTDNRTTERLMAMLEERGVKHELEHDLYVEWVDARGNDVTAFETSCKHKGDVLIVHVFLTPEQAIAATLGSGTLTAEQVRKCVRVGACDHGLWGALDEDTDWQEIADELNAELGSGTCRLHYGEDDDGYDGWYCDECGGWFQAVRRDGHLVKPKHCQECGKAAER